MPIPIWIGLDNNLDLKSIHVHVCVYHTYSGPDNIFGSIKLFFIQHVIQPNIAVNVFLTGKRITDSDKQY